MLAYNCKNIFLRHDGVLYSVILDLSAGILGKYNHIPNLHFHGNKLSVFSRSGAYCNDFGHLGLFFRLTRQYDSAFCFFLCL